MNHDSFDFDQLIEDFEEAWESGNAPSIADVLSAVPDGQRWELLVELVKVDLERRWKDTHEVADASTFPLRPRLEDYAQVFPQLNPVQKLPIGLIVEEYRVRRYCGDHPVSQEYIDRFALDPTAWMSSIERIEADLSREAEHVTGTRLADSRDIVFHTRCPHCHDEIEVSGDFELQEIECDSCGNHVSLLGVFGLETLPDEVRQSLGHFELISVVGMGHFGAVWKARDTKLDRFVAIKVPRRADMSNVEISSFFREARTAAQFKHKHIVPVYETGRHDGSIYIVSAFIEGVSLRDWIRSRRLTLREAVTICHTIADAIHYAHEAGVVHRDLKPGNVMIDRHGEPHIMDFGLAKREVGEIRMTMEGKILGTPAYMSPEQADGKGHDADRRSDIYSLGVILYELLTGVLPFRGEIRMLIHQIINDEPTSPRRLDNRIPRDLETVCLKCLEKDPARRYETADEVAADLQRYLDGKPVHARPISKPERLWRWCLRNRAVASLIAAVIVVSLTGAAFSSTMYVREAAALYSTKQMLSRMYLREAYLLNPDDVMSAIPWMAAALSLDEGNPEREPISRMRIAAALDACPRLEQMWFHDAAVEFATSDPTGRLILTVSHDKTARVWDALTGEPITNPLVHSSGIFHGAISDDGKYVATACADGSAWIWKIAKDTKPVILPHGNRPNKPNKKAFVYRIRFCPEHSDRPGQLLVATACFDYKARVWDVNAPDNPLAILPHTGGVRDILFDPTGRLLVTCSDDSRARIWHWSKPKSEPLILKHDFQVSAIGVTADGSAVITGMITGQIQLWETATGGLLTPQNIGHSAAINQITCSANGSFFATASDDKTARLWSVDGGKPSISATLEHQDRVLTVGFSADENLLATAGVDQTARVWDTKSGMALTPPITHTGTVSSAQILPGNQLNARLLTSCGDGTVRIWRLRPAPKKYNVRCQTPLNGFSRAGDSNIFYMTSKDRKNGLVLAELNGESELEIRYVLTHDKEMGHTRGIQCSSFSKDGNLIATGGADGYVMIWDVRTGQPFIPRIELSRAVSHIELSVDGRFLLTQDFNGGKGSLSCWDLNSSNKPLWVELGHFDQATFNHDSTLVAAADKSNVIFFEAETGISVGATIKQDGAVNHCRFHPLKDVLLTSCNDKTARLWQAPSGKPLGIPMTHDSRVLFGRFNAEGTHIATAAGDNTARVFETDTGKAVTRRLPHFIVSRSLMFNDAGTLLLTIGKQPDVAYVWSVKTSELALPRLSPPTPVIAAAFAHRQDAIALLQEESRNSVGLNYQWHVFRISEDDRDSSVIERTSQLFSGRNIDRLSDASPLSTAAIRDKWTAFARDNQ